MFSFGAPSPVRGRRYCSEVGSTPDQGGRGHMQGCRCRADHVPGACAEHLVPTEAVIGAQPQRRGKVGFHVPAAHVPPRFAGVCASRTLIPSTRVKSTLLIRDNLCRPIMPPPRSRATAGKAAPRYVYATERRLSFPVLSPRLSIGVPSLSNIVRSRFAIGVPDGYRR